jgi:hypothetical protein
MFVLTIWTVAFTIAYILHGYTIAFWTFEMINRACNVFCKENLLYDVITQYNNIIRSKIVNLVEYKNIDYRMYLIQLNKANYSHELV